MKIQSAFKPAWWLTHPHLQTLYPSLFRQLSPPPGRWRERLMTPDNDFIDVDWYGKGQQALVILLHGLTGSSQSSYIIGLQKQLLRSGFRSVALNFRGCSGHPNDLARCYHSGETEDIHFLYQTIRQREPETPLAAIGFSLGGNVLLKWLGGACELDLFATVAVSVPFVLSACATRLDHGFSRLYRYRLIKELKQYIQLKQQHFERMGNAKEAEKIKQLGDLSNIRSFWQYDDRVVAKLHGYASAADYYQQSSSGYILDRITIPTLLIQAKDDPFMTESILPSEDKLADTITLELTQKGGHVGFVTGHNPAKPLYWLEQRIPEFLRQKLTDN